ncbi:MAG TPA: TlpA disulfide reductase family protein [Nitrosomonas halophila]|nr:TlpA disulfide reductase family protein [Nitrosomonas halophila]
MKNRVLYSSLLASLWLASTALANPQQAAIHPFVKGSFAQIQNKNSGKPFLLTFWSETCSYCMDELALLGKMQKIYPKHEIVIVATDPFLDENIVWQTMTTHGLQLTETWVFGEYFPEMIYRDVDTRWRGELPLTFFVDAQGNKHKHMGIVNEEILRAWFEQPEL